MSEKNEGLKIKYLLAKADGSPVDELGIYFVLKLNSDHEDHRNASLAGARAYADEIRKTIPKLADDLEQQCYDIEAKKALNWWKKTEA